MPPAVRISCSPEMASVPGPTSRPGVTPSIVPGVTGLADADDQAVLHADIGLDDAEQGVDNRDVRDHQVERAAVAGELVVDAHAVAQRLAAAIQRLITQYSQVPLDLQEEAGVTQADLVADCRAEQPGVLPARDLSHPLVPVGRYRGSRARPPVCHEAVLLGEPGGLGGARPVIAVQRRPAVDEVVEPVHPHLAAKGDQSHLSLVAGLEPQRRAGRRCPVASRTPSAGRIPVRG